jgi:hypothetical protein
VESAEQRLQRVDIGDISTNSTAAIFQSARQSMHRKVEACVAMQGEHFYRLL